ncbi:MAG: TadE family type IV pilus minor pilin [Nitriliruptorales bacterium]|nr:TadE family type IV pilus minor pilin [Nitriliruptorales bacterium]
MNRRDEGVLSLEFALALPLLLLAVLTALQGLVLGRDVLLAHEAARAGARAAATSTSNAAVDRAVTAAIGDRAAGVTIQPAGRSAGDTVTVEVVLDTHLGPKRFEVRATAATRVEPGVGQ